MLWKNILLVALGGSIGSVARYLVQKYWGANVAGGFPLSTFLINILGCLLIGVFYGLSTRTQFFTHEHRLLLMTGLCGGFTTFSAFTLEGMNLVQQQRLSVFFLYFALSVILGLAATFAGYWITQKATAQA